MAQAPESGAAPGSSSSDSFVIVGGGGGGGNHQSAELGVEVMWQRSGLLVCELLPNHPAELSGMIHEGDVIKAVKCAQRGWTAWQTTAEMSVDEGADMLRGAVGDLLRLRIAREEAVFDCTIELTKPWVPVDPSRIKRRCVFLPPLPRSSSLPSSSHMGSIVDSPVTGCGTNEIRTEAPFFPTAPRRTSFDRHPRCRSCTARRPDPPAKRVTARDIEESIASASAKVHASSRGAVQDKADEMEMQIMRRRRWAEGQAQNEPYTSRSGRAVCCSSHPVHCQDMFSDEPFSATRHARFQQC
jgi:hypothetical protein